MSKNPALETLAGLQSKGRQMITPGYSLTATERILPRMALDFTTAALDSRVAFTRSGDTATVINNSGVIVGINANLPRFDFNPSSLICRGLLMEEARTNLLLNSLIDGTSLSTQTVTVTAAAHTLSFYGSGTVTLSGAHAATVNGAGAYPTRTIITFTPTAGSLTLTVTGTVQFANLELGGFATSFIPTDGTTKTRNADNAEMTGTNFSNWYNTTEGTFVLQNQYTSLPSGTGRGPLQINSDATNFYQLYTRLGTVNAALGQVAGVTQWVNNGAAATANAIKTAFAYKQNSIEMATDGVQIFTDTSANLPTVNKLLFPGSFCGWVQKLNYYPSRLTSAELRAFSKQ